jgi:hypothetical protein
MSGVPHPFLGGKANHLPTRNHCSQMFHTNIIKNDFLTIHIKV